MNDFSQKATQGKIFVADKLSTGIEGLDNVLEGGLPANHVYLVEGEPGTGKTTLALQFLLEGASQSETGLYMTLSQTTDELINIARSHGWSSDGFEIYELTPLSESLKPETQYTIFHPSEIELNETTRTVFAEVERIKPKRVVFDSLSEMRLLARDPLRYRQQILAFKQYFATRDCTVLLLDYKTTGNDDLQVCSIVHGVISLEHLVVQHGSERRRLRVTKLRGARFSGGYHDFIIETGGIKVFPRLVPAEQTKIFERNTLGSGIKQLDKLLGGGLDHGTSTLIIGPTGSGKSSLAVQFGISAAEKVEKSAIFIFDEILENYITRASGLGTKIEQHLNDGLMTIQQVDPTELAPGEFAHTVIDSVKNSEARVVVIDSLNGYSNAMPEERFLTIQMHELLTYLNKQGVVTILIMGQQGFFGSALQSPDISYLADTVIMLHYFEAAGAIRRAVSVVKKRTGMHESTIRELRFSSKGITVGKTLTEFQGFLNRIPTSSGNNETSKMNSDEQQPITGQS